MIQSITLVRSLFGSGVLMMKLITDDNVLVLEAESKEHLLLQMLIFFECNDWKIDFENNTFKLLDKTGRIAYE